MPHGGVQIQTLVEVQLDAQARLVDVEEPAQPGAEQRHHVRIGVGESDLAVSLGALAGVQRRPGDQEIAV
ncbi:MAG TPA: hypothetical protein VMM13_14840 [Euzebya sp.]|nr:hypothetical protein [Euzebya sp.]